MCRVSSGAQTKLDRKFFLFVSSFHGFSVHLIFRMGSLCKHHAPHSLISFCYNFERVRARTCNGQTSWSINYQTLSHQRTGPFYFSRFTRMRLFPLRAQESFEIFMWTGAAIAVNRIDIAISVPRATLSRPIRFGRNGMNAKIYRQRRELVNMRN